ncbi:MAG: hypothetical protein J3K34DRAFT_525239 [Monoraphidium minutum]|nr:MAG: hypothetical protein J3K34DRAFT_525239 [Monoraphidium minutum]
MDPTSAEFDSSCVPYSRRPEWAGAETLPLPPGDAGRVVAIQYAERHAEALSYFRAVLAKGEKSTRAHDLARHLIGFNGADYTAWQWRWRCAQALGTDLEEEAALTERIARDSAKNYQLWNHRRKVAGARGPGGAAAELAFAARALDGDEKNYHAWAHRQARRGGGGGRCTAGGPGAVVAAAGCWEEELRYSEAMIERDVRNNSAWAQRAFIKLALLKQQQQQQQQQAGAPPPTAQQPQPGGAARAALLQLLPGEFEYVSAQLAVAPRNESAWNYLLGLFALPGATPHEMGRHKEVFIICREALADCASCAPALDALAQYLFDMACLLAAAAGVLVGDADSKGQQQQQQQQQRGGEGGAAARAAGAAAKALEALTKAGAADPMRRPYLRHRAAEVEALLARLARAGG